VSPVPKAAVMGADLVGRRIANPTASGANGTGNEATRAVGTVVPMGPMVTTGLRLAGYSYDSAQQNDCQRKSFNHRTDPKLVGNNAPRARFGRQIT